MPRNAAGVYSLPNPPRVPDTTIDSPDENTTRNDLATEITNSLDRNGRGGMLAPFRIADGLVATPGLSFLNEVNSGLWRSGAGVVNMAVQGANIMTWDAARVILTKPMRFPDGVVANPSMTFSSDASMGIYRVGASQLGFAVAGAHQGSFNQFGFSVGASAATATIKARFTRTDIDPASGTSVGAFDQSSTLTANSAGTLRVGLFTGALNQGAFNATLALSSGGALNGILSDIAASGGPGVVTALLGIRSIVRNIGTGAVTTIANFQALPINSGGGVVDNALGYHAPNHAVGSTLRAGFTGEMVAAAGAWNLYMPGTAANYLAGQLRIGSTADNLSGALLQVTGTAFGNTSWLLGNPADGTVSGGITNFSNASKSLTIAADPANVGAGSLLVFQIDGNNIARMDALGNFGLNTTVFGTSAAGVLAMANAVVEPTTSPANIIQIYSKDSSLGAANSTLALRTEQAVEAIGTFTPSHKLRVWINAVEYWLQLDAVI